MLTLFQDLVISLRKHFKRIILPEAPAHGFSSYTFTNIIDAETVYFGIVDLINKIIEEKSIIFGNSMGGGIAAKICSKFIKKMLKD
ncbi:MAG: hypothetical protein KatS3mg068_0315 [Candidatus Sericytochromatia bacterium]|nr:MAG: hypothetical protein KatS3mg068_0315 [Candidatus Sericytochromatia bacterium]